VIFRDVADHPINAGLSETPSSKRRNGFLAKMLTVILGDEDRADLQGFVVSWPSFVACQANESFS